MKNTHPQARNADLVISELPEELLVYDLKTHQAHCLNHLAAMIWRHCDGKSTVQEIAQRIEVEDRTLLEENAVWAALEQLSQNNLLLETVKRPADVPAFSRRRAMRKIGLGAALAVPLVMSVSAPTAAQAGTTCTNCIIFGSGSGRANTCVPSCGSTIGTCYNNSSCQGIGGNFPNATCNACFTNNAGSSSWRAL